MPVYEWKATLERGPDDYRIIRGLMRATDYDAAVDELPDRVREHEEWREGFKIVNYDVLYVEDTDADLFLVGEDHRPETKDL